jgi:hypothetical protein
MQKIDEKMSLNNKTNGRGIMGIFSKKPSPSQAKMISLQNGEEIVSSFDVVKSKRGKGKFHITNQRVIFETLKDGAFIAQDWGHLQSAHAKKKDVLLLVWGDDAGRAWRFELKFKILVEQIVQVIEESNAKWARDTTLTENDNKQLFEESRGIKIELELPEIETEKIRKTRSDQFESEYNSLKSEMEKLQKEHDSYPSTSEYWMQREPLRKTIGELSEKVILAKSNIDGVKTMRILRDPRIPQNIPNDKVWNDCYFDENWNGYVTFNERMLIEAKKARETVLNKKFQKEINNGGLIFTNEGTFFSKGYPARMNVNGIPILLATIE